MGFKLLVLVVVALVAADEASNRDGRSASVLSGHHGTHGTHGHGHHTALGHQTNHGHHGGSVHGHHTTHQTVHGHGHRQHAAHGIHTGTGHHSGHGHHGGHGHHSGHGDHGGHGNHGGHGHHAGHGHSYVSTHQHTEPTVPACAANTTKPWCLEDSEYPIEDVRHAAAHYLNYLLTLYADVIDLNTAVSVERPNSIDEETYLCPSQTAYVKPLRAINTDGRWRTIVNNVELYHNNLTQTTRVEECLTAGSSCPLVPECYTSRCLQKSVYHRFLVYDAFDHHFPFAIETFKLPSTCACLLDAYTI